MSADNWTTCHFCEKDHRSHIFAEQERIDSLYGTVPVEQFDTERSALADLRNITTPTTFREDYEFWGADEGLVQWSYKGRCSTCGAHVEASGSQSVTR